MSKFKTGDEVIVVKASRPTYWYSGLIGHKFILSRKHGYGSWYIENSSCDLLQEEDIELMQDEKETISKFLRENKWFIRTGSPEKSKLVQEWLFEHGMQWAFTSTIKNSINEKLLTNTYDSGEKNSYIMFSTSPNKTNAQEIKIEFETIVKSVQLPEAPKKTEQEVCIIELEATIAKAQEQVKKIKEEM